MVTKSSLFSLGKRVLLGLLLTAVFICAGMLYDLMTTKGIYLATNADIVEKATKTVYEAAERGDGFCPHTISEPVVSVGTPDILRNGPFLSFAAGKLTGESTDFRYCLMLRRIPFIDVYLCTYNLAIAGAEENIGFYGHPILFLFRIDAYVDSSGSVVSSLLWNNLRVLMCIAVFAICVVCGKSDECRAE